MADQFQQVRLETASGEFVGTGRIPQFTLPPTVMLWGDRGFKWVADLKQTLPSESPLVYREIPFIYVLTEIDPPGNGEE